MASKDQLIRQRRELEQQVRQIARLQQLLREELWQLAGQRSALAAEQPRHAGQLAQKNLQIDQLVTQIQQLKAADAKYAAALSR
jgi:chromosome segregation ATPase